MTEKMLRRHAGVFLLALLCAGSGFAQTRKGPVPQAPKDVLRAVSVYEWTGDLTKPTAARVVPVSLYIDHHFEDAGLYLSRPMPLALEPGNIYELESAGVDKGTVTLSQATRLHGGNAVTSFDEGWFGYGTWKPLPVPKAFVPSNAASNAHVVNNGEERPHFTKKPDATTASTTPAASQSKPSDTPPSDPDRPVLHRTSPDSKPSDAQMASPAASSPTQTPTTDQNKTGDNDATANSPNGNADRPTLHRPAATDRPASQQKRSRNDSASVTDAGGLLADDPGRPHLHHGGATTDAALPGLRGLPADMHQMAAVSDAAERPEHNFAYEWPDESQKAAMTAKLETLARAAVVPATAVQPVRTASARRRKAAPVELLNEELHAYEISYGGVDVFVFTARTATEQYVTLIAQLDIYGVPHVLLQSVAGATHLDEKPQMRFIDAVDADGDNRAELLFELRGETQRQFALYRIAQDTATQEFATGPVQ
jgi:hypothetical protein